MHRAAILLFLAVFLAACSTETTYQGIRIEGPSKFHEDIIRALKLIEEHAPERYADLCRLVKVIRLTRRRPAPGVAAYCDGEQRIHVVSEYYYQWAQQVKVYPVAFYYMPAIIVHEAVHLLQMNEGREARSPNAELEAIQAEQSLRTRLIQWHRVVE